MACTHCTALLACQACGAWVPDQHKFRTAFQCQHALWTTLAPLLPPTAATSATAPPAGAGGAS